MPGQGVGRATDRPRILFVSYTSDWTGPSHSLLLLLRHLGDRFEPGVAVPGQGGFAEAVEAEGIPVYRFESLRKSVIPALTRLIRRERFDAVYGNNTSSSSENALIAARLARVPFLCHVRSMSRKTSLRRLLFLRFADAVIAVSSACADAHRRYAGQPPCVVHNGVSPDLFDGDRAAARSKLLESTGWQEGALLIMGVAHICRRKGQRFAIDAMARIAEELPRARMILAGALDREPDYVEWIRQRIAEEGLGERVRLLGLRHDLPSLLPGADVFVHTALADPHPRAVVEAMAASLPVTAFSVDGVAETVVHGGTGFLVEPEDSERLAEDLLKLLRDPGIRRQYGEAGRRRAIERFSADETARRVGDIIERTLIQRRARTPRALTHHG